MVAAGLSAQEQRTLRFAHLEEQAEREKTPKAIRLVATLGSAAIDEAVGTITVQGGEGEVGLTEALFAKLDRADRLWLNRRDFLGLRFSGQCSGNWKPRRGLSKLLSWIRQLR